MIILRTSDGGRVEVEEAVAMEFRAIRSEVEGNDGVVFVPNITSKILHKVVEYCRVRVGVAGSDANLADWDVKFLKKVDQTTLWDLLKAADSLEIESLLDLVISNSIVTLRTNDAEEFVLEARVAAQSDTLKELIVSQCVSGNIFLPNITSAVMSAVIEYLHRCALEEKAGASPAEVAESNAGFVKFHYRIIFDLIRAAAYLEIDSLLQVTAGAVSDITFRSRDDITKEAQQNVLTEAEERHLIAELGQHFA